MPAIERSSGSWAAASPRGSGGAAPPAPRSSGRRTGCEGRSSAAVPADARAAARRRSPRARRRRRARAPLRSSRTGSSSSTEREIPAGDREARLRERHLEVVDHGAEERQPVVQIAQRLVRRPRRTPRRSRTRPAGGRGSGSRRRPTGSPAARRGSRCRRGGGPGERRSRAARARRPGVNARKNCDEPLVLPDKRAVRRAATSRHPVEQRAVGRSTAAPAPLREGREQRSREGRLEVLAREPLAART